MTNRGEKSSDIGEQDIPVSITVEGQRRSNTNQSFVPSKIEGSNSRARGVTIAPVPDIVYSLDGNPSTVDKLEPSPSFLGPGDPAKLGRVKSLVRMERSKSLNHRNQQSTQHGGVKLDLSLNTARLLKPSGKCQKLWEVVAEVATCCIPAFCLKKFGGKLDKSTQHAWREKTTLCMVSLLMCVFLGYFTFYLQVTACPAGASGLFEASALAQRGGSNVAIFGDVYDLTNANIPSTSGVQFLKSAQQFYGRDMSSMFLDATPSCSFVDLSRYKSCQTSKTSPCFSWAEFEPVLRGYKKGRLYYQWKNVIGSGSLSAYNGRVMNVLPAFDGSSSLTADQIKFVQIALGKDATFDAFKFQQSSLASCLSEMYFVGQVDQDPIQCIVANVVLNIALIMIASLVLVKFLLAAAFAWFLSWQLGKIEQSRTFFATYPERNLLVTAATHPQSFSLFSKVSFANQYKELYTLCLVTCYSEGVEGLRTTMDSLAQTDYHEHFKMIFVVADGVVKGSGNTKPTGDIVLDMIELDEAFHGPISYEIVFDKETGEETRVLHCRNAEPQYYAAVGTGSKAKNMAKIYCGTYVSQGKRVATILVYKVGCPSESTSAKPGNRGKRDSQIILMDFLSKTMFDEPMSALQFDLFTKWTHVMTVRNGSNTKVTPDLFEIILMVDADTKVNTDSLTRMVAVMQRDPTVMGLCGETRIMNKNESWVAMIQVFEYYVSHHLAKAFESIFGGVTCLPGCFCMYRIKAPKPRVANAPGAPMYQNEDEILWIPVLANPDIVADYSEPTVDTLHKKNLLLLGEDRYLTTLMLRTFPKRKMMFVPKAICKTQVPTEFSVLLSQRRRWINSTIHNLMELVLVPDLCGIFCFSMQFVIFLELVGTATLPAAIIFTGILVISAIIGPNVPIVPLALLAGILGLPAILIFFTTGKYHYFMYMAVYILALPIWNFVLPVYAFWHFDDFSWGQTRQVAGEKKGGDANGHGNDGSEESARSIEKRWHEWERIRRKALNFAEVSDPVGHVTAPFERYVPKQVKRKRPVIHAMFGIKTAPISTSNVASPALSSANPPTSVDIQWRSRPGSGVAASPSAGVDSLRRRPPGLPEPIVAQHHLPSSPVYSVSSQLQRPEAPPASSKARLSSPAVPPGFSAQENKRGLYQPPQKQMRFQRQTAGEEGQHDETEDKALPEVPDWTTKISNSTPVPMPRKASRISDFSEKPASIAGHISAGIKPAPLSAKLSRPGTGEVKFRSRNIFDAISPEDDGKDETL